MKIVIDTNIVYSALYSSKGASHQVMTWLFQEDKKINVISTPLVTEFEDVLTREKSLEMFQPLTRQDITRLIDDICAISHKQKIHFLWRPYLTDVKDDMVLETAFNAAATYIVTHNLKDFSRVEAYFGIQVITPQQFLNILGDKK